MGSTHHSADFLVKGWRCQLQAHKSHRHERIRQMASFCSKAHIQVDRTINNVTIHIADCVAGDIDITETYHSRCSMWHMCKGVNTRVGFQAVKGVKHITINPMLSVSRHDCLPACSQVKLTHVQQLHHEQQQHVRRRKLLMARKNAQVKGSWCRELCCLPLALQSPCH